MSDEMHGIADGIVESFIAKRCSPERFQVMIELVADDLKADAPHFGKRLSDLALLALSGPGTQGMRGTADESMEDSPERRTKKKRAIVRRQYVNHLMMERGFQRWRAKELVDQLSDAEIDVGIAAAGKQPAEGFADWMKTFLQFIKEHWVAIAAALLPFIIALI